MSRVLAVCAGRAAPLAVRERGASESVASAIAKVAISSLADPVPVRIDSPGVAGDEQVDRSVHGGPDKAVYVYPHAHYAFWRTVRMQAKIDAPLAPGAMGENLLVEGLLESGVWVGDTLAIGELVLRVESPRSPCFKFNAHMGFAWAAKMMVDSGFCGFYCSVVHPGILTAGDTVLVRAGDRVVSIDEAHRLKHGKPRTRPI